MTGAFVRRGAGHGGTRRAVRAACVLAAFATMVAAACRQAEPLPVLSTVPDATFTSHRGEPFALRSLDGRPYVAAFVFTRCRSICPMLTSQMVNIRARLVRDGHAVPFVAFSVDPTHDTPEILAAYARARGAGEGFTFLTGDPSAVADVARRGYLAAVGEVEPDGEGVDVLHTQHLLLVDGARHLRGFYRTDRDGLAALERDVGRLLAGE